MWHCDFAPRWAPGVRIWMAAGTALALHWYCTDSSTERTELAGAELGLHRRGTGSFPTLHWYSTGTALALHWHSAGPVWVLCWCFCWFYTGSAPIRYWHRCNESATPVEYQYDTGTLPTQYQRNTTATLIQTNTTPALFRDLSTSWPRPHESDRNVGRHCVAPR